MKTKRFPIFTAALNAATAALNSAQGIYQELAVEPGEREIRYRLSPFGEFPVTDVNGNDIIQVVDRQAAETMAANFSSLRTKLATFCKGIPMYEGHPDDPQWLKDNPGHKAIAVARLKTFEIEDDGPYVTAVLNSKGVGMLEGEAPEYTGHSPNWRLSEIPGRKGHFRPILLWSDGLTNMPNIMQNTIALNSLQGINDADPSPDSEADAEDETEKPENTDIMLTPEALKALGFGPDATPTPEEISAAIIKLVGEKTTAETAKTTAEGETNAANSRANLLSSELESLRGPAVTTVIDAAVADGRITEADKPRWTTALNASFGTEAAKLAALMPTINTTDKVGALGDRRLAQTDAVNASTRITDGVRAFAKDKGIDITTDAGWTRAFDQCRAEKPDLFPAK